MQIIAGEKSYEMFLLSNHFDTIGSRHVHFAYRTSLREPLDAPAAGSHNICRPAITRTGAPQAKGRRASRRPGSYYRLSAGGLRG